MLLAIDIGNTNIVLGVFDGAELLESWRLATLRERTADELGLLVDALFAHSRIEKVAVRSIILGSVVPPLTGTMQEMTERYFGVTALTIEPGTKTGMPILYESMPSRRTRNSANARDVRWSSSTSEPRRRSMRSA
jgi:type III pantothenate kinase